MTSSGLITSLANSSITSSIGALTNSGSMTAASNAGTISTFANTGTIATVTSSGSITSLTNSGTTSSIGTLSNTGSITTASNAGTIASWTNSGTIGASAVTGVINTGVINSLSNTGTITGSIAGINNAGTIKTLTNSQSGLSYKGLLPTNYNIIINSASSYGVAEFSNVSGLMNFGIADGSSVFKNTYLHVLSGISASNLYSLSGSFGNDSWVLIEDGANIWDLSVTVPTNYTISSNTIAYTNDIAINSLLVNATVSGLLSNISTISGGATGIINAGSIATLSNTGIVNGSVYGVQNTANIGTLINTNVVSGNLVGVFNNAGTIASLSNANTIYSANGTGIKNTGLIKSLVNSGSISGLNAGIYNAGTISTLTNAQSGLGYKGVLPTNYNEVVSGTVSGNFGGLSYASSGTLSAGMMNFGIASGSTIAAYNYAGVLTGLNTSNLQNLTGIYANSNGDSYIWSLGTVGSSLTGVMSVASAKAGTISTGTVATTAELASNPGISIVSLNGGTINASSSVSTISQYIATSTIGGFINQNAVQTSIANQISGSGMITITNTQGGSISTSGVVALSANNSSFSGGFEVDQGATLRVGSASALGTGTISLVGSNTISATLSTTADMAISNPITVAYDPTFDVASGTALTISSPITDGVSSGDVVITGGGTLDLTAANTYTGGTTITSGSTLALSGTGSITTSSGVYNYGTFDITNSSYNNQSNPVVVSNYTQSSSGTLKMNIAPTVSASQMLQATGSANIGGTLNLNASSGTYVGGTKYTIVNATGGLTGGFSNLSSNLSSYTPLATKFSYDANNAYLDLLNFSTANTQQSLVNSASALQSTYAMQNSVLINSFSYDCNDFGEYGACFSVGGRSTNLSSFANSTTSALIIGGYRVNDQIRVGAYLDQNLSASNPTGIVQLGNHTPVMGAFVAWKQNDNGTGPEVKLSGSYSEQTTTITRQVVSNTEPGSGSSTLYGFGGQASAKYGFAVTDNSLVSPYVGIRYSANNMSGYTENTSSTVQSPLTYQALNTNAKTVIGGVAASHKVTPDTTIFGSVGFEQDVSTNYSKYSASGINGLTPVNFNSSPVNTRAAASAGVSYQTEKNQWITLSGSYREAPYKSLNSTSVMVYYTFGM